MSESKFLFHRKPLQRKSIHPVRHDGFEYSPGIRKVCLSALESQLPKSSSTGRPQLDGVELTKLVQFKVSRLVASRNGSAPDSDLHHEVMLRVIEKMESHDPARSQPLTFAERIIPSILIDLLRSMGARKRTPAGEGFDTGGARRRGLVSTDECPDVPDPDDGMGACRRSDRALDVQEAIARLPADLQQLAIDLQTWNFAEIAIKRGCHRGTIQRQAARIRKLWQNSSLKAYVESGVNRSKSSATPDEQNP